MAFIDYEKAFDSVNHQDLFSTLRKQNIQGKAYSLLKKIYSKATARIKLENYGKKFSICRGVRQGDALSPKLSSAILEEVFRQCNWPGDSGLRINGENIQALRFVDDLVLFSTNACDLQRMIREMKRRGEAVGLKINIDKTKLMTNGYRNSDYNWRELNRILD